MTGGVYPTRELRALETRAAFRRNPRGFAWASSLSLRFIVTLCVAVFSAPTEAELCPPGPNLADTDENGLYDYACVGDWNDNGACEMEGDIQAGVAALNDPGPKTILVDACDYAPPVTAQGHYGIINLTSNTTLMGVGPETKLNGFAATNVQSEQAVITNSGHGWGDSNIVVSDLQIDGGWRGGDGDFPHARMGVRFTNCINCVAERLVIKDTLHACLYASNSSQVVFRDSTLERCGNLDGLGAPFPCVYLFAYDGGQTQDVLVHGIDCDGSGGSAFTTRRDATNSTLIDLVFEENVARNTAFIFNGARRDCFTISGVGSAQYLNNTCIDTGGLTSLYTESWYSDALERNASANVTVDGLDVSGSTVSAPIVVQKHAENFTLRNITVSGAAGAPCLKFLTPLRNFSLDGADLSNCGEWGIHQVNDEASGVTPDETLDMRNIEIHSAGTEIGADGIRFRGPVKGLLLDNVTIDGVSRHGVRFDGALEDSTISNLTISNVDRHGIYLQGDTRNVALTFNDVENAGSDCIFLEGSPAPAVSHRQTSINESSVVNCGGRGIAIGDGNRLVEDLAINDNVVDAVDGDGMEITLAGQPGGYVEVQHNILRNIGRETSSGPHHGIDFSGDPAGVLIYQNTIEDWSDHATHGIRHDAPGSHPTYLCSNLCSGTLTATECLHDSVDPGYETDTDLDGTVDACEDDDGDDVYGPDDNCPEEPNPLQADTDLDGQGDACDNCPAVFNPEQTDFDSDDEGDLCDLDDGRIYLRPHETNSVDWQPESGYDGWNLYRGDLALLVAGGDYTQEPGSNPIAARYCGLDTTGMIEEDSPGPGQIAFYLVSGLDGFTESGLGSTSSGMPRPNTFPCSSQLLAVPAGTSRR